MGLKTSSEVDNVDISSKRAPFHKCLAQNKPPTSFLQNDSMAKLDRTDHSSNVQSQIPKTYLQLSEGEKDFNSLASPDLSRESLPIARTTPHLT